MISITHSNGGYTIKTPYNAGFIAQLKSTVPATERRYNPEDRTWTVAIEHGDLIQDLILQNFGKTTTLPVITETTTPETRSFDIRYVGATKDRGESERSAFGYSNGSWSVVFPESILRMWFEGLPDTSQPSGSTLYGLLGIKRSVAGIEIKRAFRRLAVQWHPDHCKERDAADVFMKIKEAYDILSNPAQRARYDAGLALEASIADSVDNHLQARQVQYRPPLRCGYVLATGVENIGRFVVSEILAWEDIINNSGQTLVTSWDMKINDFTEEWIQT